MASVRHHMRFSETIVLISKRTKTCWVNKNVDICMDRFLVCIVFITWKEKRLFLSIDRYSDNNIWWNAILCSNQGARKFFLIEVNWFFAEIIINISLRIVCGCLSATRMSIVHHSIEHLNFMLVNVIFWSAYVLLLSYFSTYLLIRNDSRPRTFYFEWQL